MKEYYRSENYLKIALVKCDIIYYDIFLIENIWWIEFFRNF